MKRMKNSFILGLCFIAILFSIFTGCAPKEEPPTESEPEEPVIEVISPAEPEDKPEENIPEEPEKEPEPPAEEPKPIVYTLSFAGDCTLGTEYASYGSNGSFVQVIGDNYSYPFENVLDIFENDDFTFVNFEGVLSEYNVPAEKKYRFRAPPAYSKIVTAGNIEAVNLSNNHSYDYGKTGYADTKAALESENITYVETNSTAMFTTETGLKIGLYAGQFNINVSDMKEDIALLRSEGAEIVICSFHWGIEGSYRPNGSQKNYAHAAIDAGADIVFGHHPHVLQPIEQYGNGVIYYSLGNFSFGGNRNPTDKDTAIIQQTVIRELDGTVHLGETNPIPCSLTSTDGRNDYRPIPYEVGSDKYNRTLSKLDGSFTGPDLVKKPEPAESPEEGSAGENGEDIPTTPTTPEISPDFPANGGASVEIPSIPETGTDPSSGVVSTPELPTTPEFQPETPSHI